MKVKVKEGSVVFYDTRRHYGGDVIEIADDKKDGSNPEFSERAMERIERKKPGPVPGFKKENKGE